MDPTSPTLHAPPAAPTPCGPECRYAEPLRAPHDDWIWCHRPNATVRLCHPQVGCHWFNPGPRLSVRDRPA